MTLEGHTEAAGLAYRGPVEELLESRLLARDFEVEWGSVRVETRVRISRSPWSVTSTILENGVEVQEGQFAAVSDEVDIDSLDPESFEDLRREFAAQVVALHESRCRDVERALNGGEAAGRTGGSRGAILAVGVALSIAAVGGAGYYLWQEKSEAGGRTVVAAAGASAESGEPVVAEGEERVDATASTEAPEASGPSPPTLERPDPGESERSPPVPPVRRPTPSPPPPPRADLDPEPPDDLEEPETVDLPSAVTQTPVAASRLVAITDLRPEHYRLGVSALGDYAFSDDDAVLASAPPSHLGLSCVRTSAKDRTRDGSLTFIVDRPVRVLVGHDSRIGKKPGWLRGFMPLGLRWEVDGVGLDEAIVNYEVFARSFAPGMVRLGPNVEWTALTRRMRNTFEKDLAMYLVCVESE